MTMNIGDEQDDELMAEINTTPLVDVMLVLMIVFLVTAPTLTQAIKLDLPSEAAQRIVDKTPLVLSISQHGAIYNGEQALSTDKVKVFLAEAFEKTPPPPLHIRADVNVPYGRVSSLLAEAQRIGLHEISFITAPAFD